MKMAEVFDGNLFSFAEMLSGAPGGGVLRLSGSSLAAFSGLSFAGENYALLAEGTDLGDLERAARFFEERGAQFVLPSLPRTPHSLIPALEKRGHKRRAIYTSMYLPSEEMPKEVRKDASIELVRITDEAVLWAKAVWFAFGGEEGEACLSYLPFGEYLAARADNCAFALQVRGKFVSTALICETDDSYGLYYFATMPEFRRHGLAAKLMDGLTSSLPQQKPLVLLATEAGLPFYTNYGFKTIDKIPIYSAAEDI